MAQRIKNLPATQETWVHLAPATTVTGHERAREPQLLHNLKEVEGAAGKEGPRGRVVTSAGERSQSGLPRSH